ncbi:MAG: glutamate synthase [Chloroflexi bacterium]|nr:glutamate synthase [Chloroflexota bacterium]
MDSNMNNRLDQILRSRGPMLEGVPVPPTAKAAEEGGCGVVGFACSIPVRGRHIFEPSLQMHNRGNGKGGGIAAVGMVPEQLGVSRQLLDDDYLLQIALLDPSARSEVEDQFINTNLEVHQAGLVPTVDDYREVPGLEIRPPDLARYFVRVRAAVLERFIEENGLGEFALRQAEDEFIYRNSFRLNQTFYASLGEKRAFVLSHGRDLMILKIVGYAEQVAQYYRLEDFKAHIWIAHQRYPTKGRVWHPAGAHPFIGLNEALVHNGDFANYHGVCEYLRQRNVYSQFLTDTEVSVLLFDLLYRVYGYPLECVIEALAPTTELDFDRLPAHKQEVYRHIQSHHVHSSPDGPWFFIIARSEPDRDSMQLLGITDTAMLRPQVFALSQGEVSIGLVASEKQAIDATLHTLAAEDARFSPIADRYWNARGGSSTDGGAFSFTLTAQDGGMRLTCADKFGKPVELPAGRRVRLDAPGSSSAKAVEAVESVLRACAAGNVAFAFSLAVEGIQGLDFPQVRWFLSELAKSIPEIDPLGASVLETLTLLNDRRYATGGKRRSDVLALAREASTGGLTACSGVGAGLLAPRVRICWDTRQDLASPSSSNQALVVDSLGFPPEGDDDVASLLRRAYGLGWRRFIVYDLRGQRFIGCGFGPDSSGVRIDVYGSSGDYLASGLDGMEIQVHGAAQDQLAQIMKAGKLVVYGDVGQTFMYGAKGGEAYVLGNAAGRPLINAGGRPKVVINGTCLDFLAESFMAGDPLNGGGFVVLNGLRVEDDGSIHEQEYPYAGANLFSLASGGAIYIRDPHRKVVAQQLNGGEFASLEARDWELILPFLQENERLFGISVEKDLLTVGGVRRAPAEVYRKVRAVRLKVLAKLNDDEASLGLRGSRKAAVLSGS